MVRSAPRCPHLIIACNGGALIQELEVLAAYESLHSFGDMAHSPLFGFGSGVLALVLLVIEWYEAKVCESKTGSEYHRSLARMMRVTIQLPERPA